MIGFNIFILIFSLLILYYAQKKYVSFNKRVLIALLLGTVVSLSLLVQNSQNYSLVMQFYNLIGVGYVRLLQMMIFPIIAVSILSAMTKIENQSKIGKALVLIIVILLSTTAIASFITFIITSSFNIDISSLLTEANNQGMMEKLVSRKEILENRAFYQLFTDFIPTNPFADLTGSRNSSIGASVIFFLIIGISYLGVNRKEPEIGAKFKNGVDVLFKIVMRMVIIILRLSPYGMFALLVRIGSNISFESLKTLSIFILISYLAIIAMFLVHLLLLKINGYSIRTYLKKILPLLIFAFSSRSSAASIPININTQIKQFGINDSIASASASFGATMGQNACAGIYPTMLVVLMAPVLGIDIFSWSFLADLLLIVTISSFGIAGVGGGATFAAIAVLSHFNMPLTLLVVLIAVEPLIDMARTALNVNGAVTSSLITANLTKNVDKDIFNAKINPNDSNLIDDTL